MKEKHQTEWILHDLSCSNCANKIEHKIKTMPEVSHASMNFTTKTLRVTLNKDASIDEVFPKIKKSIRQIEPGVIIDDQKIFQQNTKKEIWLEGLHCESCANQMEKAIGNIEYIENVQIDFEKKKVRIETKNHRHLDQIISQVNEVVQQIDHDDQKRKKKEVPIKKNHLWDLIRLSLGAVLFFTALIFDFSPAITLALFVTSYIIVGGNIVIKAFKNMFKGLLFDENFLMTIATIGAFAIGQYGEGVAVMLFYRTGELFQNIAVNHSRKSIGELMDLRPDYANLKREGKIIKVSPEEVKMDDVIVIRPGEKVPLDGKVIEGLSSLDTSAITGESIPREVAVGDEILSGTVNQNGAISIRVSKPYDQSTVSKIMDLVETAGSKKAPTENFITKFARYYTPFVVFTAILMALIPPLFFAQEQFADWLYRALIFLVVSCPCALVISIPLGFFGGIGGASKQGILFKGGNYLEALNNVDTIVFDKTGTLTKGIFEVTKIKTFSEFSKEEILEYAAYGEGYSNHPIGKALKKAYGEPIDPDRLKDYEEAAGYGIKTTLDDKKILVGNEKWMDRFDIQIQKANEMGTMIHVAVDDQYIGYIVISDQIKEDAKTTIEALRKMGIQKMVMLTGDTKQTGEQVGKELGLDQVFSQLLPQEKLEKLEQLESQKTGKGKLLYVGDGINDAPVLMRADVGVAMGGLGSDAAIEAADVVLMNDQLSQMIKAIQIAKKTRKIVWQNILLALTVKGLVLLLAAGGMAAMWEAVFADVGVTVIAVFNAMRVLGNKT